MSNSIKAVFFDLDGTLRHSVPEGGTVFNEYVASLRHSFSEEDRLRALRWEYHYWAFSADLRDDLIAHSADTENFWVEYARRRLIALGASSEWADQHRMLSSKASAEPGRWRTSRTPYLKIGRASCRERVYVLV